MRTFSNKIIKKKWDSTDSAPLRCNLYHISGIIRNLNIHKWQAAEADAIEKSWSWQRHKNDKTKKVYVTLLSIGLKEAERKPIDLENLSLFEGLRGMIDSKYFLITFPVVVQKLYSCLLCWWCIWWRNLITVMEECTLPLFTSFVNLIAVVH